MALDCGQGCSLLRSNRGEWFHFSVREVAERWAWVRLEFCCPAGPFSGDEPAGGCGLGLEFRAWAECGGAFHDLIMHVVGGGLGSGQSGEWPGC